MAAVFSPAQPSPARFGVADPVERWGQFTLAGNLAFEQGEDVKARQAYAEALSVAEAMMVTAARAHDPRAVRFAPSLYGITCNNIIELAKRQDDGLTAGIFLCKLAAGFLSVMECEDAPNALRSRCLQHSRIVSASLSRYFEERGMWEAAQSYTARANAAFFRVQQGEPPAVPLPDATPNGPDAASELEAATSWLDAEALEAAAPSGTASGGPRDPLAIASGVDAVSIDGLFGPRSFAPASFAADSYAPASVVPDSVAPGSSGSVAPASADPGLAEPGSFAPAAVVAGSEEPTLAQPAGPLEPSEAEAPRSTRPAALVDAVPPSARSAATNSAGLNSAELNSVAPSSPPLDEAVPASRPVFSLELFSPMEGGSMEGGSALDAPAPVAAPAPSADIAAPDFLVAPFDRAAVPLLPPPLPPPRRSKLSSLRAFLRRLIWRPASVQGAASASKPPSLDDGAAARGE